MRWMAALMVVAACSSSQSSGIEESGSRLRIRWLEVEGDRKFVAFHDPQLDDDCLFTAVSGGGERCVPSNQGGLVYSDAACSQALGTSFGAPVKAVVEYESRSGCQGAAVTAAYRVQPDPGSYSRYYAKQDDGSCQMFPTTADQSYYTLSQIDLSTLVAATHSRQPLGSEIVADVATGADGSRALAGFRLAKPDAPCTITSVGSVGSQSWSCLPPLAYVFPSGAFSDAGCTTPAASTSVGPACPTPLAVLRYQTTSSGCGIDTSLFDIGAPLDTYYSQGSGSCMQSTQSGAVYAVGAASMVAKWPAITVENGGTGRVRLVDYRTSDGARMGHGEELFDSMRNQSCTLQRFSDGNEYCVPSGVIGLNAQDEQLFKDSACTQRVVLVATGCGGQGSPQEALLSDGSKVIEVHSVSGPLTQSSYYRKDSVLGCGSSLPTASDQTLYDLGPTVDPASRFGVVHYRVE